MGQAHVFRTFDSHNATHFARGLPTALYGMNTLPVAICVVFVTLGVWHFYWALGGTAGKSAAIPEINGRPTFKPSSMTTAAVGLAFLLLLCAALVAVTAGFLSVALPRWLLPWPCYALAFVLLARAIGEFRVGAFFKRVHGTPFARLDTAVYSPLCLALSIGVFFVGFGSAA